MKKIIFAAALLISLNSFATDPNPTAVNEKVLNAFSQAFKNVENPVWSEYENYFEVKFKQNAITSRIQYDVDGNIMQTTRYYFEENLPIMLRAKLQKKYSTHKVFGVTEISTDGETLYHIVLEDQKNWTIIRAVSHGDMYVHQKYKKA